ncbi:hypothetical protein BC939DRAFT_399221 [Gamsiella multidivaricata]|uniref:uncharacterized protein n=1 Tax=Gamsiella multidivaricata TaxID=101098 RepID=UPI00221EFFDD|nr:uncharacterized protein BC939DRAFT_399221 [Gamsiella multidivaricata]KAI7820657.1 hypothetical protein BC939DRAFT_399221 [Gamsiella multidivaricata]
MDLIRQSPFARILETRSFKELNKKASTYLNLDWSRYPQAGYITAHLLSGSVITNIQSGQTILVNEVEFYGRDAMLDCHKEPTGEQKGVPEKTSIPSTTGEEYYKRVRPVTLRRRDGVRLVIGTNTCGVLVTSCIRVDRILEGSISVGGDTRNFEISESELKNIRVFVDNERLGKGKKMKKKTVKKITKDFGADRLRQVRSKFHRLNTFRLIRCSGPLTDAPQFRPFSVFTIGRNSDRDSASSGAAHIFYKMALAVIHYQEKATFTLEDIRFGQQLCQSAKDISIPMQNIHELFAEVDTKIPIIGNKPLNKQLHAIAEAQSTRIAKANKNVATELKDLFLG